MSRSNGRTQDEKDKIIVFILGWASLGYVLGFDHPWDWALLSLPAVFAGWATARAHAALTSS